MPRRPTAPESAEDKAVREVLSEDERAETTLGAQAGPPPDAERLSEADEDRAWEMMDDQVDPDQMASMLMTQGLPPEIAQKLLVFKVHPDWLPAYQQPTQSAELADQLTRHAQFPFRLAVLPDPTIEPDEHVQKAERLDRRYQQRMAPHMDRVIEFGAAKGDA